MYYINKAAGMRIREDRIMEQVDEIISGIQYSADFGELLKRLFREAVTKNDRTKSFDENVLKRKIVALESKKKKLLGLFLDDDGGVSIAWKREFSYILDEAILRLSDAPSRVRKCTVMHASRDIIPTLSDHINQQAPIWLLQFIAA